MTHGKKVAEGARNRPQEKNWKSVFHHPNSPKLLMVTYMQAGHETLSEWLPFRDRYTFEVLDLQKPPVDQLCSKCQSQNGCFRCKECSQDQLCHACCFIAHRNMPLHRIEKWTGQFFDATSLNQEGFVLRLGHDGEPCPASYGREKGPEIEPRSSDEDGGEDDGDGVPLAGWEKQDRRCLVIVPQGYTNFALAGAGVKLLQSPTFSYCAIAIFQQAQSSHRLPLLFPSWTTFISTQWSARHLLQASSASFEG
jgi:hypothetical protein